jgi:hypothetical protein
VNLCSRFATVNAHPARPGSRPPAGAINVSAALACGDIRQGVDLPAALRDTHDLLTLFFVDLYGDPKAGRPSRESVMKCR